MSALLNARPIATNTALLILRAAVSSMFLTHGWAKLSNYKEMLSVFSDPIGLGNELSLVLVIFAEFFCSLFVILGLYTRLALIPMMFNMIIVVIVVHGNDPFGKKELGLLYLSVFVVLFLIGPGRYSIDASFRGK